MLDQYETGIRSLAHHSTPKLLDASAASTTFLAGQSAAQCVVAVDCSTPDVAERYIGRCAISPGIQSLTRTRFTRNSLPATYRRHEMKGAPDCPSAKCGIDAGCRRESDGSFICICTHDLSPQREDGSCPRIVISNSTSAFNGNFPKNGSVDWDQIERDILSSLETNQTPYSVIVAWSAVAVVVALLCVYVTVGVLRRRRRKLRSLRLDTRLPVENVVNNPMYAPGEFDHLEFAGSLILLREWIELDADEIGEGFFGKVYRGRLKRSNHEEQEDSSYINVDGELVAVKKLKPVNASLVNSLNDELIREASTVASFSHPNILTLKGVVFNECNMAPWIVFEFMDLGDLAEVLRRSKIEQANVKGQRLPSRPFIEDDLISMAEQIARGMEYLSSKQYVHRDLACRNALVTERPSLTRKTEFLVKVSDFGMSRSLDTSSYYQMQGSRLLPVRWMAPEAILYGKFCLESDVWSYGVVLWEVFSFGAIPFCGCSNEQVVDLIRNGSVLDPPDASPAFIKDVMTQCWHREPRKRLTFSDICDKFKEYLEERDSLKDCRALYLETLPDALANIS